MSKTYLQKKIYGLPNQVISFDENGVAIPVDILTTPRVKVFVDIDPDAVFISTSENFTSNVIKYFPADDSTTEIYVYVTFGKWYFKTSSGSIVKELTVDTIKQYRVDLRTTD